MSNRKLLVAVLALVLVMVSSVMLTACSTATYTVSFDSDGGSAVESQTVEEGGTATKPTDPTKSGYTFSGWVDASGSAFSFSTTITADTELKATWTAEVVTPDPDPVISYKVTVDGTEQTVESGKTATEPTQPTKDGYVFAGWVDANGYEFSFDTAITADTVVTSSWLTIVGDGVYTGEFSFESAWVTGSYYGVEVVVVVESGKIASVTTGTDSDTYFNVTSSWDDASTWTEGEATFLESFVGMTPAEVLAIAVSCDSSGATIDSTTMLVTGATQSSARVILAVQNALVTETATSLLSVTVDGTVQYIESGDKAVEPTEPTKTGYKFAGWVDANGEAFSFDTAITADTVVTSSWTEALDSVEGYDATAVDGADFANTGAYEVDASISGADITITITVTEELVYVDGSLQVVFGVKLFDGETQLTDLVAATAPQSSVIAYYPDTTSGCALTALNAATFTGENTYTIIYNGVEYTVKIVLVCDDEFISDTYYVSTAAALEEALAACASEIVLTEDITLTSTITLSIDTVIYSNGHTIDCSFLANPVSVGNGDVYVEVVIKDVVFVAASNNNILIAVQGEDDKLTLDSCTFSGISAGNIIGVVGGELVVTNCSFSSFNQGIYAKSSYAGGVKVTISDSSFESGSYAVFTFAGANGDDVMTVENCTFTNCTYAIKANANSIVVTNCTFTSCANDMTASGGVITNITSVSAYTRSDLFDDNEVANDDRYTAVASIDGTVITVTLTITEELDTTDPYISFGLFLYEGNKLLTVADNVTSTSVAYDPYSSTSGGILTYYNSNNISNSYTISYLGVEYTVNVNVVYDIAG